MHGFREFCWGSNMLHQPQEAARSPAESTTESALGTQLQQHVRAGCRGPAAVAREFERGVTSSQVQANSIVEPVAPESRNFFGIFFAAPSRRRQGERNLRIATKRLGAPRTSARGHQECAADCANRR